MALIVKDRVLESSTSSGTGSFTLTGAQTGYQSFSAIGNGNTTYYTIQGKNPDGTLTGEWEVGVGTWSTGNTLARNTVLSNSLGTTAKIAFSAGSKDVFVTYPSDKALLGTTSAVSSTGTGSVVLNNDPFFDTDIYVSDMRIGRGNQANSLVFGQGALFNNTTGDFNSAVGIQALGLNTTGNNNTALGNSALYRNTTASNNTAIGYASLLNNANGISNTAVGSSALTNLKQAGIGGLSVLSSSIYSVDIYTTYEVDLVYVSGTASTTGNYGTALLYFDGDGLLASVSVGNHGSGFTNLTTVVRTSDGFSGNFDVSFNITSLIYGSQNTALGYLSGSTSASGQNNILLGYNAQPAGDSTDNEIVIGSGAVGKGTNSIVLGNSGNFAGTTYIRTPYIRFIDSTGSTYSNSMIYSNVTGTLNGSVNGGNGSFNDLTAIGSLQLAGSSSGTQNILTNQASASLNIGGTGATGAINIGRSSSTQTVNIGGVGNIINVGATTGTGTLTLGRSTGAQIVNIATGATPSSTTKTINIGTGGATGANTIITIGRTPSGTTSATTIQSRLLTLTGGAAGITISNVISQTTTLVGDLSLIGSAVVGSRAFVTDALAPVFGSNVIGGGAVPVPVYYDGSNWKVG